MASATAFESGGSAAALQMRADRLLSIVLLLQHHSRLTSGHLAKRLEVSERTIHRDMSSLGGGVPVVADRGVGGGWSLMPGYRASISNFTESEVRALFVGLPASLLEDLHLRRASDDAALKLLSAMPAVTRHAAELARQRIHIDLSGWMQSRDPVPLLPIVQDAVWSDRRLHFTYGEHADERVVDALGLVVKGTAWYLVAMSHGELRSYRVSRMRDATVTRERFERPANFDLGEFWQASAQRFKERLPRFEVVARVKDLRWLQAMMRYGAIDSIDGDIVRMHFDSDTAALSTLIGTDAVVIEPDSLRENIIAAARAVIDRSTPAASARRRRAGRSSPSGEER